MKRTAIITSVLALGISVILPQAAFAEVNVEVTGNDASSNVNVHQEGSSSTTICQNGKCTTTGGGSKSTYCVNGKCTTTDDNVDYQSEDGNTRIKINNNSSDDEVGPTISVTKPPKPTITKPTITITQEEIDKKVEEAEKKVDEAVERIKERAKSNDGALGAFIKAEMNSLTDFLENLFK